MKFFGDDLTELPLWCLSLQSGEIGIESGAGLFVGARSERMSYLRACRGERQQVELRVVLLTR